MKKRIWILQEAVIEGLSEKLIEKLVRQSPPYRKIHVTEASGEKPFSMETSDKITAIFWKQPKIVAGRIYPTKKTVRKGKTK